MLRNGIRASITVATLSLPTFIAVACTDSSPVVPREPELRAARGGGGPGQDPVVRSVTPDTAQQGDVLRVMVSGDNFEPGSTVDWLIAGTPTGDVQTNATAFVDKRTLAADITVATAATVGLYDVRVTTPPGRRGIGSEKFEVKQTGNPNDITVSAELTLLSGYDLTSDGSSYLDGRDGVGSTVNERMQTYLYRESSTRELCWDLSGYTSLFPGRTAADLPFDQTGFKGCVGGSIFTRDHGSPGSLMAMDSSVPELRTMLAGGPIRLDDPDDDGWYYVLTFGVVGSGAPDCAQAVPGANKVGEGFLVTMVSGHGDVPGNRRWTIEPNPASTIDAVMWRFLRSGKPKPKGKPQAPQCVAVFNNLSFFAEIAEIP